jgi:uncharacterized protein YdeI (BOF family)
LALAASPVLAQQGTTQQQATKPVAKQQQAGQPASKAADGEWIRLSGTVKSVAPKQFTMSYPKGEILVEMDPFTWNSEKILKAGDKVAVTGRMDKDFFEANKIEASSVYVPRLKHFFYASPADEEDGHLFPIVTYTWDGVGDDRNWFTFTGTVLSIDDNEMKLDTGTRALQVDAGHMFVNRVGVDPLAAIVDIGDRVAVSGWLDDADLFDQREVQATALVVLSDGALASGSSRPGTR